MKVTQTCNGSTARHFLAPLNAIAACAADGHCLSVLHLQCPAGLDITPQQVPFLQRSAYQCTNNATGQQVSSTVIALQVVVLPVSYSC